MTTIRSFPDAAGAILWAWCRQPGVYGMAGPVDRARRAIGEWAESGNVFESDAAANLRKLASMLNLAADIMEGKDAMSLKRE